ncbi:hypothetical protein ASG40_08340 [Methylobacterium sp. Leaf399]|uniref:hypothetical protein n=1 Tax=unclassified Methylobacterium TaxID=2615210 RepID=UPI0007013BCC|nr:MULTISPECIES: hypothetical protein [unclassified Methylobacterium]KQP58531.1 hypothetical protein ASF39_18040 [Methylobacterium sp. Leaf108]KQT11979.1 hypothetical protein ASG40_08340 [Methylobacterium sp. Leaf399]KQT88730.1 hypothetical protein ASG59_15200 [Methylobacterium sp. Leaf466]
MTLHRLLTSAAVLVALAQPLHAQGAPPDLDLEATCRSAGSISTGTQKESRDGCLRSEREARDEVKRRWGEFTPAAKTQCGKQAQLGGSPGYVEMVTCLELASGNQGTGTDGVKGKPSRTTPVQPAPEQRTNPIDVLGRPAGK